VNLEQINSWADDEARASFLRCCGSARWADAMARRRPFDSEPALFDTADRVWCGLSKADWIEAFAAHPRIGDLDALRARFTTTSAWASREQAGVAAASEEILRRLADGNSRYEARFGYIFIVCATRKTAQEMLELLKQRLSNDPETEIKLAAGEQMKITRIRLERIAP
jgi:2-oxo-4-hydroxy-4-carboxy-5-ureidoimidazoline decarboxylase